jgi:hypothetical protein
MNTNGWNDTLNRTKREVLADVPRSSEEARKAIGAWSAEMERAGAAWRSEFYADLLKKGFALERDLDPPCEPFSIAELAGREPTDPSQDSWPQAGDLPPTFFRRNGVPTMVVCHAFARDYMKASDVKRGRIDPFNHAMQAFADEHEICFRKDNFWVWQVSARKHKRPQSVIFCRPGIKLRPRIPELPPVERK